MLQISKPVPVSVINGTTNSVIATVKLGPRSPWEVAFNPANGHLYVTNTYNGTVSIIDGSNNSLIATAKVGAREDHPNGIAYNSFNHEMYVVESVPDSVFAIDSVSNSITAAASLGSTLLPWGMASSRPIREYM